MPISYFWERPSLKKPLLLISLANQDALHARPRREISPTTEPEPSGKVEPEPSAETETWPEPGPDWMKAYKTWGRAWHFHTGKISGTPGLGIVGTEIFAVVK